MATDGPLNFDVTLSRGDDGGHVARSDSPFGGASHRFKLPFEDREMENLTLRVGRGSGRFRASTASHHDVAKDVGSRLFESVFGGEVGSCFQRTLDLADRDAGTVRLRLKLTDAPELTNVPWEFLFSPRSRRFFALSLQTPVVRYLETEGRIKPLRVMPPLRALVAMASPPGYPELDIDHEWSLLKGAVEHLEADGRLVMERLAQPSLACLQDTLRAGEYHIFHFVGHGGYSQARGGGVVLLENAEGRGVITAAERLATVIYDERSLRLAILNSCEGARADEDDVFSGAAQALLHAGIPAVIGMQNEISDEAAIIFAQQFYGAIADGSPVDTAIGEARKGMYARQEEDELEWCTPVLYMRATDGHIFDLTETVDDGKRVAPQSPSSIAETLEPARTQRPAPSTTTDVTSPSQVTTAPTPGPPPVASPRPTAAAPSASPTYCRRCGTPRTGPAAFCRRCGSRH